MLNADALQLLAIKLKEELPIDAKEIADSLDLVVFTCREAYTNLENAVSTAHRKKDFCKIHELASVSENLDELILDLEHIAQQFIEDEDSFEIELAEEEENLYIEKEKSPDYSLYTVDNNIPHYLDENFEHKRPCAFELQGQKYFVNTMEDVLLQTCELLARKDLEMFNKLVDDKAMRGRKNLYFSNQLILRNEKERNKKVAESNIYVWTNSNNNLKVQLLRKLLKKFKISTVDFKIYLRADYNDLHK